MRIVILTQDDPFYLGKNINYLAKNIPSYAQIVGTVLFDVSPFGKRESFWDKTKKTFQIFGFKFFIYYSFKFLISKFNSENSVAKVLIKNNIPLIQLDGSINSKSNRDTIKAFAPDLLVSIGGNQIFKKPLLELATYGCINLHTALLPKYRGLMPSFWVLKNNETHTGVSVFFVDEGIDSGPILVQKKVEIGEKTQEELIRFTKQIGMDSILEAIDLIQKGDFKLLPNPQEEMTYFSFPTKADVKAFYKAGKKFF
jgi:methionyl-tRNA formyltransferase